MPTVGTTQPLNLSRNNPRVATHVSLLYESRYSLSSSRQPLVGHRRVADGDHGVHVFLARDFQTIFYASVFLHGITANPIRQVPNPSACAPSRMFWVASRASSAGQLPPGAEPPR